MSRSLRVSLGIRKKEKKRVKRKFRRLEEKAARMQKKDKEFQTKKKFTNFQTSPGKERARI